VRHGGVDGAGAELAAKSDTDILVSVGLDPAERDLHGAGPGRNDADSVQAVAEAVVGEQRVRHRQIAAAARKELDTVAGEIADGAVRHGQGKAGIEPKPGAAAEA